MLVQVIDDIGIGESSHPESFGVVSGEFRFLKVAGHVQDKQQLVIFSG